MFGFRKSKTKRKHKPTQSTPVSLISWNYDDRFRTGEFTYTGTMTWDQYKRIINQVDQIIHIDDPMSRLNAGIYHWREE
jgi:hypothetical protein